MKKIEMEGRFPPRNVVIGINLGEWKKHKKIYKKKPIKIEAMKLYTPVEIKTFEGIMKGELGDYLIRGIEGEFYPCKSDIFKKTYEKVIFNGNRRIHREKHKTR